MKISECVHNCRFLLKKIYPSGSREYRCLSEKAPEKKNAGKHTPGYMLKQLKSCPEGLV